MTARSKVPQFTLSIDKFEVDRAAFGPKSELPPPHLALYPSPYPYLVFLYIHTYIRTCLFYIHIVDHSCEQ